MVNTDLVQFSGFGSNGSILDLWGTGFTTPEIDSANSYSPTTGTLSGSTYTFNTEREFYTGDSKDFKFECGKEYDFKWVGNDSTPSLVKHNKSGSWKLKIDVTCEIGNVTKAMYLTALAGGLSALAFEYFV